MGGTIAACQRDLRALTTSLRDQRGLDVRFSLIAYRDHHLNEEYCTKTYPFTRDQAQMQANVDGQRAGGGGDGPEAVTAALFEALCLDWRPTAAKQVVIMADAGPHGLGGGDSFPDGDPDGKCPLSIAREMLSLGIVVYSIYARGHVSPTDNDALFFSCLSGLTAGVAMSMGNAAALQELVIAGAYDAVTNEAGILETRAALESLAARKGRPLTPAEEDAETRRVLAAFEKAREAGAASVRKAAMLLPPPGRLTQAQTARDLKELVALWRGPEGSGGTAAEASPAARITAMRTARDARPTDKVVVECITDGAKVRAKIVSAGYDPTKNVQFPRGVRTAGKRFVVETVVDAGSFYRVRGEITEE
jgi:hypothetical protein